MNGPLRASAVPRRVKQTTTGEYAIRFLFGGLVTVGAGLVATRWGPVVGGLFLAFPSILPASLTLVKKHSKLRGAAGANGLGAGLGSLGLLAFALVGWASGASVPAWLVLLLASIVWVVLAGAAWAAFQRWHLGRHRLCGSGQAPSDDQPTAQSRAENGSAQAARWTVASSPSGSKALGIGAGSSETRLQQR